MAASIIDVVASGHIDRSRHRWTSPSGSRSKTPRYWVAQATLAVAAWLDDNPQQHRQALDYALRLDYEKTSLFMALLLRDQDRDDVLQEWLAAYLSRLTPVRLPRHFQVVIDAATGNAFGGGAAPRLVRQVGEWYREESGRQDIFDATVSEWKRTAAQPGRARRRASGLPAAGRQRDRRGRRCPRGMRPAGPSSRPPGTSASVSTPARQVSDDVRRELAGLLAELARTEDPEEEGLVSEIAQEPRHHAGQGRPRRRQEDDRRRRGEPQDHAEHRGDGEPVRLPDARRAASRPTRA